jgi:hypothetical protein
LVRLRAAMLGIVFCAGACGPSESSGVLGTVALGDNIVAPDLALDEDIFFCRIQPDVLTKHGCAAGRDAEAGTCHDSRSALRLLDATDAPSCKDDRVIGELPDAYAFNLDAVRFFVQGDPLTSPLYLRPLQRASHPRRIFDDNDAAAELLLEWISAGAR